MTSLDEMLDKMLSELTENTQAGKKIAPIDGATLMILTALQEIRDEIRTSLGNL